MEVDKRIGTFEMKNKFNINIFKNMIENIEGEYTTIIYNEYNDIFQNDIFEKMINLTKRENSYNFKYHYFGANTY